MAADFTPDREDILWRDFMKTQPEIIQQDAAFQAAFDGNAWFIECLLDMGVAVDTEGAEAPGRANMSLLHIAVEQRRHNVAEVLIRRGADVNVPDENVELILIKAINNNDAVMLQMLMNAKADARQTNEFGESAIDLAQGRPQLLAIVDPSAVPMRRPPTAGGPGQNKGL